VFGSLKLMLRYVALQLNRMNTDELITSFVTKLRAAGVPIRADDNSGMLDELEQQLPKRLPQSMEYLLSHYSFPSFDVDGISLFAWMPDSESNGFFGAALAKKGTLSELLLPAGYVQIGRPATGDFDAICVDLNGKAQNRENRIVRADHEQILCNWRVKITCELWPSFRRLVASVLANENVSIYYEEEFDNH